MDKTKIIRILLNLSRLPEIVKECKIQEIKKIRPVKTSLIFAFYFDV